MSQELMDVILSLRERPELDIAGSFVAKDLSDLDWKTLAKALEARIQKENRRADEESPVPVVNADGFAEALSSGKPILVEFGAKWCPPCRLSLPLLEDIASRNGPHVKIIRVDIDASPEIFRRFPSETIPYFVCIKNGEVVGNYQGLPATEIDAKAMLQDLVRRCYGKTI